MGIRGAPGTVGPLTLEPGIARYGREALYRELNRPTWGLACLHVFGRRGGVPGGSDPPGWEYLVPCAQLVSRRWGPPRPVTVAVTLSRVSPFL